MIYSTTVSQECISHTENPDYSMFKTECCAG